MVAPKLFTLIDAGEVLGVSASTVQRWVNAGELRASNVGSDRRPRLRIREDDLRQFIDDRTVHVDATA